MGVGSEGIGDSSSEETRDGEGLSGAPESEPDLAPIGESEWAEADGISAPPERQEPELAPADESENGIDGEGSTPPGEPDSSENRGLGEGEQRDNNWSTEQDALSLDRLRAAFEEAQDQDVGELGKALDPFGDVQIAHVRNDDQSRDTKGAPKEAREVVSG